MIRIKIPSGSLTADALDGLGHIVERYVPLKKGHATTRENIQVHFVKLSDTPEVMRLLGFQKAKPICALMKKAGFLGPSEVAALNRPEAPP